MKNIRDRLENKKWLGNSPGIWENQIQVPGLSQKGYKFLPCPTSRGVLATVLLAVWRTVFLFDFNQKLSSGANPSQGKLCQNWYVSMKSFNFSKKSCVRKQLQVCDYVMKDYHNIYA